MTEKVFIEKGGVASRMGDKKGEKLGKRVFLVVLDSFGIGSAPDAEKFGDEGSNTLASVFKSERFFTPNLAKLGLFNIDGVSVGQKETHPLACFGRLQELSAGKDTTCGHWEIGGAISNTPMPVFPDGFDQTVIEKLQQATGRKILCNKVYSGTDVIKDYGERHLATGDLIVYTSADSVLQIAAHESVIPIEELYETCRKARQIMTGKYAVGRIIARPFDGVFPNFVRTPLRKDFCLAPPKPTVLDCLNEAGFDTIAIGKINDIFSGRGIDEQAHTIGNLDGMNKTAEYLDKSFCGLCFVNLVDFDTLFGHRNDINGYAAALTEFDRLLGEFMSKMKQDDILILTADHGCDPAFAGTDHTREYVPLLVFGDGIKNGINLNTRVGFCDIGKTICDLFGVKNTLDGTSFLKEIILER